jgi:hypothetical protein
MYMSTVVCQSNKSRKEDIYDCSKVASLTLILSDLTDFGQSVRIQNAKIAPSNRQKSPPSTSVLFFSFVIIQLTQLKKPKTKLKFLHSETNHVRDRHEAPNLGPKA